MLLSPRKNGLTSLNKEVRGFKEILSVIILCQGVVQGPDNQLKRRKAPFVAAFGPIFNANLRWLRVALSDLKWPKVA